MDINLNSLSKLSPQSPQLAQLSAKLSSALLSDFLQKGAQFTATVIQDKGSNQYLLEVYNPATKTSVQVTAESVTALESGHPLQLEVLNGGPPPQVRIVQQQSAMGGTPVENALRQFLPKQQELSSLVSQLADFAKSGGQTALPADIQQLARSLLASLPDKNTLVNAEGLKQAVRDSGLFLESKLAQLAQADPQMGGKTLDPALANDLKAKLLVLADALAGRATPTAQPGQAAANTAAQTAAAVPTPANAQAAQTALNAPNPQALAQTPQGAASANAASIPIPEALLSQAAAGASGQAVSKDVPTQTAPGNTADATIAMGKHAPQLMQHERAADVANNMAASTEPSLKELSNQTEGALAKLVLNQLASLAQPDANQQIWRVDIPFTVAGQPNSAKLEIEREENEGEGGHGESGPENAPWSVTVEINPPGLGKLGGKLSLHDGAINAFFWSENPATAALVQDNLPLLQARLEAAGLKTGQLNASMGIAPPNRSEQKPRVSLLDLRA